MGNLQGSRISFEGSQSPPSSNPKRPLFKSQPGSKKKKDPMGRKLTLLNENSTDHPSADDPYQGRGLNSSTMVMDNRPRKPFRNQGMSPYVD
mmetsp:Transcript_41249/g.62797  ORF Transcript_41249/g.62797 Transcript_41249/m.62797 type:complete len:92 (-) Transcript_41249:2983-3258(-)|eukprot:CAMPEP_0170498336 /NCGR_PEP_ID=MMETSP0208-20121228/27509_1 /TAXON_ID=197538 /ORGANISM="Strombidium inclinatum, Strain S3" /LENGTH=91 /DNA_ID=CAMNT_0010775475 /DNA_START=2179 /DNA_END=2454 /DNA_ORIENTATION=+